MPNEGAAGEEISMAFRRSLGDDTELENQTDDPTGDVEGHGIRSGRPPVMPEQEGAGPAPAQTEATDEDDVEGHTSRWG